MIMNKVELAKMLGLTIDYTTKYHWQIKGLLENDWDIIEETFCNEKFSVTVDQEDLVELEISEDDMISDGDIKVCTKQVGDLIWERAADIYLKRVHRAAMLIGGDE
jgi:hypothetical protein